MVFEEDKFRDRNPFPFPSFFDRIWIWVPIPILTSTRGIWVSFFLSLSFFLRPRIQPQHEVIRESVTHHTLDHPMGHLYRLHGTMHVKQLPSITHPSVHPFIHHLVIPPSSIFLSLINCLLRICSALSAREMAIHKIKSLPTGN